MNILYLEDHAGDADAARRHFAKHASHIRLDVVANQSEAVERLQRKNGHTPYDVLLLEYSAPGPDVLEMLKELELTLESAVPVGGAFLSGSDTVTFSSGEILGTTSCTVIGLPPPLVRVIFSVTLTSAFSDAIG